MKTITLFLIAICATSTFAQCSGDKANCAAEKSSEGKFLAEANRMAIEAEGKKACCKTTAEKKVVKGDPGCCNAKGEVAKFKVFVAGEGYKMFGCADSAAQARAELLAKGRSVGKVQKLRGKSRI